MKEGSSKGKITSVETALGLELYINFLSLGGDVGLIFGDEGFGESVYIDMDSRYSGIVSTATVLVVFLGCSMIVSVYYSECF